MKEVPTLPSDPNYKADRRVDSLARTFELSVELLHIEDITAFLQRIAESVKEIFKFQSVSISILDDERGLFTDHAMAGYSPSAQEEILSTPSAFERDEILADFREDCKISKITYFIPFEKQESPISDFVAVRDKNGATRSRLSPESWHELDLLYFALLNRHGDLIGYMQVDYPDDGKIPLRQIAEEIEVFAGIAAVGIENSKMFKRTLDLLSENEIKTNRILRLLELIQSVLRIDDLESVLKKATETMTVTFGFRKGGISLFSEGSARLTVHSLVGYTADEERIVRQSNILRETVLQDFKEEFRITRTGYFIPGEVQGDGTGFVFVEDPSKVTKPRETPESWHELDLLYFAMYDRQGKMLGYIQLDYPVDGKIPTKETMETMEAFASIATIAIENSAMFKDLGEAKDQVKVYLDLLSHDVGNLMNPVNAYLEIVLGTTTLAPVQYKYLSSALEANRSMIHIIRNVRRSAQMLETTGVELVPMNLTKSVRQVAAEAKTAFLGKEVNMRLNLPEQDEWVVADNFLDDVIYNLLTNSIKYDEHEEVIIDVETKAVEFEGKNYINLQIVDRGVGIPDDLKVKVFSKDFRKMVRSDGLLSQKSKGAGMGLSIVKALMDRYKGKVWIENRVYEDFSRGSIFNLLLPVP
ncbi:MAG: GAF domain-containing sensor histidine kinase [Candidatus Thermoplasmatota archaeon]|nr:GAF domain-containing sensor histidine kinase [Candidatus Thermoplasmatota archaeon]